MELTKLKDGYTKYAYKNIHYNLCEIIKPIIDNNWQIFNFKLNTSTNKKDLDTLLFLINFNLSRMQPQIFEAIHIGEFSQTNEYTIKTELKQDNYISVRIKSPFFALSKQRVFKKIGEYISVEH